MNKEKRSDIRVELLNEYCEIGARAYRVMNISKGGMFIKASSSEMLMKPNEFFFVTFELPGQLGFLSIPCTVGRVVWKTNKKNKELGFSAKFGKLSSGNTKILDAFLIYLRNKQIMSVSKRIIEEFLGPRS